MQTTFKEQIEAIQKMRKIADEFYPELSPALNDAGSTIAAMQISIEETINYNPKINGDYKTQS